MVAQSGLDLMDRTSDPEKIEKLKAGIRHAIDRGAKLTQQLLTFARKSPLHPEVVDIGMRLRSMDTLLERSLGENFSVDYRIAPQLWPVEVGPSQLERSEERSGGKECVGTCRSQGSPQHEK